MFQNVIVRRPCRALIDGITSNPQLGKPDYEKACKQHDSYIAALKQCGVNVTVLEADERYPDSCFVEDPAVITRKCAIITNPGAESRNGEKDEIIGAVRAFFSDDKIEYIKAPGTLEGGDVMMVGDHFYVGRSARTNEEGIRQFIAILEKHGLSGYSLFELNQMLQDAAGGHIHILFLPSDGKAGHWYRLTFFDVDKMINTPLGLLYAKKQAQKLVVGKRRISVGGV